ncbi:MAG TPA: hypothetical protein VGR03_15745 [Candidatus Acidoferrum sp.]|nr:hypothetical protein [Candidatus Acidoferrum sp.]HVS73951.1 hypothetical protein [Candidatus Acidoferrales bacterium]
MADELPSGDKAVYIYLEFIALGFALEAVAAFVRGDGWHIWAGSIVLSAVFLLAGIKWPWIKGKFVSVDWVLWDKRLNRALLVVLVLGFVTVAATGYYTWRKTSLAWSQFSREFSRLLGRIRTVPKEEVAKSKNTPAVPSTERLDWSDKQNWRRFLRHGMTRTEVRRLFGDPEKMAVVSDMEFWDYGTGQIDFDMEDHPDGSLYSWFEPGP